MNPTDPIKKISPRFSTIFNAFEEISTGWPFTFWETVSLIWSANKAPYKLKYFNTKTKDIYDLYFKFENIKLVYINIQEKYKYENLLTHLFAKILTKLNLH